MTERELARRSMEKSYPYSPVRCEIGAEAMVWRSDGPGWVARAGDLGMWYEIAEQNSGVWISGVRARVSEVEMATAEGRRMGFYKSGA